MKKIAWVLLLTVVLSVSMLTAVSAADYTDPDCYRNSINILGR